MTCPNCKTFNQSRVVDSRKSKTAGQIRRRRECLKCLTKFTTFELTIDHEKYIQKKELFLLKVAISRARDILKNVTAIDDEVIA